MTDFDEDPDGTLRIGTSGGGLNFDTGKSELKQESEEAITEIAKHLKSDRGLKLYIVGHTDNVGGWNQT